MNRSELIDAIWAEVGQKVFISKREFDASLDGWTLETKELDGTVIGATLVNGPEFHFVTFGPKRALTAALITSCLQPIIDAHGFVRTKTPREDDRQHHFNMLIGFEVESLDEFYTYFRMERLMLRGEKRCQS